MNRQAMTDRIATGQGFIAALDQSGGSTPKALRGYGVDDSEWSDDEAMFAQIHNMRARVITSPCFGSGKVIGAIGVSGATSAQDEQVAATAIAAVIKP